MSTFEPPSRGDRLRALGPLDDLPGRLRDLLLAESDSQPIRPPTRGDWLDTYGESPQTFEDYTREVSALDARERCLCLLPLDGPSAVPIECLVRFRHFIEAFFMVEVRVLPPWQIAEGLVGRRSDPALGLYQWCAADILKALVARRPDDALGVLALTTADLYPNVLMDYSFGLASRAQRVGVCSLARFGQPYCSEHASEDSRRSCRECRLIAHEIGHLLGIRHCVYYACLMNGSTTLTEGDARPLHVCPIDLRKLQWLIGFDPEERYLRLLRLWRDVGACDEAEWVERRLLACHSRVSHG